MSVHPSVQVRRAVPCRSFPPIASSCNQTQPDATKCNQMQPNATSMQRPSQPGCPNINRIIKKLYAPPPRSDATRCNRKIRGPSSSLSSSQKSHRRAHPCRSVALSLPCSHADLSRIHRTWDHGGANGRASAGGWPRDDRVHADALAGRVAVGARREVGRLARRRRQGRRRRLHLRARHAGCGSRGAWPARRGGSGPTRADCRRSLDHFAQRHPAHGRGDVETRRRVPRRPRLRRRCRRAQCHALHHGRRRARPRSKRSNPSSRSWARQSSTAAPAARASSRNSSTRFSSRSRTWASARR